MVQKETSSPLNHGNFTKELSISQGKIPPNAVDFEKLVIGACLIDKEGLSNIIDILSPDVFYDPRHQEIFIAISTLFNSNKPVDLMTVIQELKRTEKLILGGGDVYIIELTMKVSSAAHIEYYSRIIIEKYILRSLINISGNIIDSAYKETTDVLDLLDKAEQSLFEVTNGTIKKGFDTANSLIKIAIDKIKSLKEKEGLSGVPSGFKDIDKATGGWQNSDLIIIAARPAMGKTAFLLSMARNITVTHQIPMALFSLEMSSLQIITRMIASETNISSEKLRKGQLTDKEWKILFDNISELENAPLYIDETPALSIFDFRAKCRRLVMHHNVKIIMVDYLQLMTTKNNGKNTSGTREQEISTISRSLKSVAKELNIPIIALSQLSRNVETRSANKRPQLSDLRDSGAIEQDADIVSFIYRPEYYKIEQWEDGTDSKNQAEIIIAKHRNGALADIRMSFIADMAKFKDIDFPFHQNITNGLENIKSTIDPSIAFKSTSNNISGSAMNSNDDFPF